MKLTYYGDFAFACQAAKGAFAINPEKEDDALLFSLFTKPDRDMQMRESWPGEYEFSQMAIHLFELSNGALGAKILGEDVRMLFLPALEKELSEDEMQVFGNVDVLILQIEEMKGAWKKMAEEIDARTVLPIGPGQEKFLVEMGAANVESTTAFDFSVSSLPPEQTLFVKLMAS